MMVLAPDLLADRRWPTAFIRYERQSASPGMAKAMIGWLYAVDVRHVLPSIRIPTLALCHADATRVAPVHGRYIAERIEGARFVELPGADNYTWAGDTAPMLREIQEFLTGASPMAEPDRVLATVLFTDIVDSTRRAAELGDARWRDALAAHDRVIRLNLERFRGREIKTTGDGFLATFDGPARAIRAALAIRDAIAAQGFEVRSGLHTRRGRAHRQRYRRDRRPYRRPDQRPGRRRRGPDLEHGQGSCDGVRDRLRAARPAPAQGHRRRVDGLRGDRLTIVVGVMAPGSTPRTAPTGPGRRASRRSRATGT